MIIKTFGRSVFLSMLFASAASAQTFSGTVSVSTNDALGAGDASLADGTTLDVIADDLVLANNIAVAGQGTVATDANTVTLAGTISDVVVSALELKGSWQVDQGPSWVSSPPNGPLAYTGREAAALLFGGNPTDYSISTAGSDAANINNLSWYSIIGYGAGEFSQDYNSKYLGLYYGPNSGYGGSPDGAASAYVRDNAQGAEFTNYAFGLVNTTVAATLEKTGSGKLILQGANTYTGGTLLREGTIEVASSQALGTGALTMFGGTTLAAGAAGLTLANDIALAGAGSVDTGSYTFTIDGALSDGTEATGSLVKLGSGNLVLNAANTYTGGTMLEAGVLTVGNSGALGTGDLAMADGTTLRAGGADLTVANNVSIAGQGSVDTGANTVTLAGTISNGVVPVLGLKGSWQVDQGPVWSEALQAYTGQEAAALLFGGNAGDYQISTAGTDVAAINRKAWVSVWGGGGCETFVCGREVADNSVVSSGGLYLNSGDESAYVMDWATGAEFTNYAFGLVNTTVAATLEKAGSGKLILQGANTYTGGTLLREGTIEVASSQALGTGALTMFGGTTLAAGATDLTLANDIALAGAGSVDTGSYTFTIDGALSDGTEATGSLVKLGSGVLTLTGANTYTGATTVAAGTLNLAGSLASGVTVQSGGTLTGSGTLGGLLVQSGGTISPGAPGTTQVSTINVSGSAALNGIYVADIGSADLIAATGPLSLNGVLILRPASGHFTQFNQSHVVATGSSRTGTFSSVTGLDQFGYIFAPVVEYNATGAYVRLAPQSLVRAGQPYAISGNKLETARSFDQAVARGYNPQPFIATYLNIGPNLPKVLHQLSGEQRATERRVALESTLLVQDAVLDRLAMGRVDGARSIKTEERDDTERTIWMRLLTGWGQANSSTGEDNFSTNKKGFVTGIDWSQGVLTAGLAFHYNDAKIDFQTLGGQSSVETTGGTLYAGVKLNPALSFKGGFSFGHAIAKGTRLVTFNGFNEALMGRTTGTTYQGFSELALSLLGAKTTTLEPFARLTLVGADFNSLTETGGIAAIYAPEQNHNIMVSDVGVRFGDSWNNSRIKLNGSVSWRSTSGDRNAQTMMGIEALGELVPIRAIELDKNAVAFKTNLGFAVSDSARLEIGYSGLIGDLNADHSVKAGFTWAF